MNKKLEELGFSKNESAVYITLLRLGLASVGKITEQSGVHRRNVYDALERLEKRGLICQRIKDKTKYFKAASPMNLLQVIEEDKKKLSAKEKKTGSVVQELMAAYTRPQETRANVTVFKGVKGVRTVFQDILDTGEENRALGVHTPHEVIASYLENFHQRRTKLGIKDMMIFSNNFDRAKELAKLPHTEVKLMPRKQDKTTAINIYGNKVAILSWSEPVSIVIEEKKIADCFRYYFDFLWKILK